MTMLNYVLVARPEWGDWVQFQDPLDVLGTHRIDEVVNVLTEVERLEPRLYGAWLRRECARRLPALGLERAHVRPARPADGGGEADPPSLPLLRTRGGVAGRAAPMIDETLSGGCGVARAALQKQST